jgi:hypothetical protein
MASKLKIEVNGPGHDATASLEHRRSTSGTTTRRRGQGEGGE